MKLVSFLLISITLFFYCRSAQIGINLGKNNLSKTDKLEKIEKLEINSEAKSKAKLELKSLEKAKVNTEVRVKAEAKVNTIGKTGIKVQTIEKSEKSSAKTVLNSETLNVKRHYYHYHKHIDIHIHKHRISNNKIFTNYKILTPFVTYITQPTCGIFDGCNEGKCKVNEYNMQIICNCKSCLPNSHWKLVCINQQDDKQPNKPNKLICHCEKSCHQVKKPKECQPTHQVYNFYNNWGHGKCSLNEISLYLCKTHAECACWQDYNKSNNKDKCDNLDNYNFCISNLFKAARVHKDIKDNRDNKGNKGNINGNLAVLT